MANAIQPQKAVVRSEHPNQRVEKFSDPEALLKLHNRALVVCHIVLSNNQGGGTGFLIGKDLIMTNNHVLDSLERARGAKALFFHTTSSKAVEVYLDPDHFFYTSFTPDLLGFKPLTKARLDFTIISIKSHPKITEVSHLAFSIFGTPLPEKESHANMIHHPHQGTTYQKISHRENLIKEVSLFTIHYTAATLPGSSGAPVIDDEGNLIALHRATCTHILKALLEKEMLKALLYELFPGIAFTSQTLTLMDAQSGQEKIFTGLCATIDGSPLYIFSEEELKGQYFHQGKLASLFRLIETQHPSPKKWALQFLNSRLEEPLADYHCECNTAVSIKAIHDHLKNVGMLAQIQACYEESQKSLGNLLKEGYLQKCASLPLLLANAAFPIESFFTQLSIVSHTSQEKKEEEARQRDPHLIEKDSLREIYARLCTTEKPIEINNLFDSHNRVLVLGRAGIGKSTLCQKIAYDWASGTLFKQFAFVYHIKLRDFNSQKKFLGNWLSQMIADSCYGGAHQEKILQELQTQPEKILLIFDGWDEASPELIQTLETYFLQTQVHYLLTSRPGVTSKIHGNFDLIVENMGFSQTQVDTYIEKFFTHTQCLGVDLFLKMLHSRSNLLTIAHIPIQLQILCALWQKGEQEFPQMLTPLFSKIVHHLLEWEQNKNLQKEKLAPLKHLFLYQALGEVALKGLESKQLIIPNKLVEETLIEKSLENNHFENTIRRQDLISTGLVKECGADNELYFLHLTYQEYSIAHYISSLPKSSLDKKQAQERQRSFVQTYRYKPQFHLVIRLLAGCIWEDSNKNLTTMETFFGWLYSGHIDLIGGYQTELALSCLDECRSTELEERIWKKYKIKDFVDCIVKCETTREYLSRLMAISGEMFMRVVQHLKKGWAEQKEFLSWFFENLNLYSNEERAPEILNLIQKALNDQDRFIRYNAMQALRPLAVHAGKENFPLLLKWTQKGLNDPDWQMVINATFTLRALATHAGRDNIPLLLKVTQAALKNQNECARAHTVKALGELAAHAGKENSVQILNWVQTALKDRNKNVRSAAAEVHGEFTAHAGKENLSQILKGLQMALKDHEWEVRNAAVKTLKVLAGHAGKENLPQILKWAQIALKDRDMKVRKAAVEVHGELAAHAGKEDIPQILEELQTTLRDQEDEVCRAAVYAFPKVVTHAKKENLPQIIKWIQTALRDRDENVRWAAAEALKELAVFAEKENFAQFLNWAQIALKDQNKYVRWSAAEALGKLATHAEKENISKILNELQKALKDSKKGVRIGAAHALAELAAHTQKESLTQILEGIQTALRDHEWRVRMETTHILGELATHVGKENITKILNWVQTVLNDPVEDVRDAAGEVLRELVAHAEKENIPKILKGIQTALKHEDIGWAAVRTTCSLKTECLLPIFTSQPLSHPELIPLIFDHFINHSIPLYFIDTTSSLYASDTCFEAFNLNQLTPLSQRCTTLLTQTKKKSP